MNPNIVGNADDIRARLQMLAAELHKQNTTAGLRLVGGAAIALADNPARAVTADIDTINRGDATFAQCARQLAQIHGWKSDWLNDAALAYFPPNADQEWHTIIEYEGLTVAVASPRTLLAMKLNSGRGSREEQDLRTLLDICNITSIQQAEELFERNYPPSTTWTLLRLTARFRVFPVSGRSWWIKKVFSRRFTYRSTVSRDSWARCAIVVMTSSCAANDTTGSQHRPGG